MSYKQFRRLAVFDTEGEAITILNLTNQAISYGFRRNITVELSGSSFVVFKLIFDYLVYSPTNDINREYPQLILEVLDGNDAIIEDIDFTHLERALNQGLPRGEQYFRLRYYHHQRMANSYSNIF